MKNAEILEALPPPPPSESSISSNADNESRLAFVELFCGAGLVRYGLGNLWRCQLAVDCSELKERAYKAWWGDNAFQLADVSDLNAQNFPQQTNLLWASFPCQDISQAGPRSGLTGKRSGLFWSVIRLLKQLRRDDRCPKFVILENVCGIITQREGRDVRAIFKALKSLGYWTTVTVLDAKKFVPQSRPRAFIIAVHGEAPPRGLTTQGENWLYPKYLATQVHKSGFSTDDRWFWLNIEEPDITPQALSDVLDWAAPVDVWDKPATTENFLRMLSDHHRRRIQDIQSKGLSQVFGFYQRMRPVPGGKSAQRTEVSFNDHAGCLRAPTGGSSRQRFLFIEPDRIRSRLPTPKELCAIMGVPHEPFLDLTYNELYRVLGEGVSPPVVRFLNDAVLTSLATGEG